MKFSIRVLFAASAVLAGCGDNFKQSGGPDAGRTGCSSAVDCGGATPACDRDTGTCVGCLVGDNFCPAGKVCDGGSHTCVPECDGDEDCPLTHVCGEQGACVPGCRTEADCPAGSICDPDNVCVPGCSPTHDCADGQTCCGSTCRDLTSDVEACGDCATPCPTFAFTNMACMQSTCVLESCGAFHANCNADVVDGCERNELFEGACECEPGDTPSCYDGAPGTAGTGTCAAGTQTCRADGLGWGACEGQVLPRPEVCANNLDEDCDGIPDNVPDLDGDGWTRCNGDCCDSRLDGCTDPRQVNPGAFEFAADGLDNDCDGVVDNVAATNCSTATKFADVTAMDVARAMDICQTTTASPPLPQKKWGLISASQLEANGVVPASAALQQMRNGQTAITTLFGSSIVPRKNATLGGLSTGMMRDGNDPGWVAPITGTTFNRTLAFESGGPITQYTNQHGGNLLPGSCGAVTCAVGKGANDSVLLRLVIRVPTNAQGLAYDFRFFTSEYQSFQCTQYNDHFLALLTSTAPGIPADKNISFDVFGKPVSVNNAFFQVCGGNGKGCGACPFGTGDLAGTGFDSVQGGSTNWLTTEAPVTPGETITLDLLLFDVQDMIYDSDVLLDNFRWIQTPTTVVTHD